MAKRPDVPSSDSSAVSKPNYGLFNVDALLESFLAISDPASIDASFDHLVKSRSTHSDEDDLIKRALHFGPVLIEAGKRSVRNRSSLHNAFVWPLPPDLTIKVFFHARYTKRMLCRGYVLVFRKCAMDPLCFANIDLANLVPEVNNTDVATMIQRAGNALQSIRLGVLPPRPDGLFCLLHPLVSSIRNFSNASAFCWSYKRLSEGKKPSVLTRSCLSSLSENNGTPGSRLRRLHLYSIESMDDEALLAALSVCPSLIDLEIVDL